jgi:FAD/FMN-containing dehydrogenase
MISSPSAVLARLDCPVFKPDDPGYAAELATFHVNTVHTPDLVVGARTTGDVVDAIHLAKELGHRVTVMSGGHAVQAATGGLMVTTHRMNQVTVDPGSRTATIGGGARWSDVLATAGPHGLLPIIGSSPQVGVAGYLLGGGLSPLGRSHGFSSDYVLGFTLVTAAGDVIEASNFANQDLFWALRGGKFAPGIVTEIRLRLVDQPTLYAGSLIFEEEHIEQVTRGWIDWTHQADPDATTSIATIDFPDLDLSPPPFRGKRILMLRFAFPGDAARGAALAAPLRELAPIFMDDLATMPATEMARIHNDPTDPLPGSETGAQLTHIDQEFATRWLDRFGAGTSHPITMVELRHQGSAMKREVIEGSAVTGRDAEYTVFLLSMAMPLFEDVVPAVMGEALAAFQEWSLPEVNVNFIGDNPFATPWAGWKQARLDSVRAKYDPNGLFASRW